MTIQFESKIERELWMGAMVGAMRAAYHCVDNNGDLITVQEVADRAVLSFRERNAKLGPDDDTQILWSLRKRIAQLEHDNALLVLERGK